MKFPLILALSIPVIVTLAFSGCIGGGSNAQTYETNWGKVQIDIPQRVSVTGIEGGSSVTIMKGVSPLLALTISEASSFNPSNMGVMGAKVNSVKSNDNHEIYWYLNPLGGFKQYLGYIDHTADKNLLVYFVLTPLYYDNAEGKIVTAFTDEEVLSILKSFKFVDFKGQSTPSADTAKKPIYHMAVIGDSISESSSDVTDVSESSNTVSVSDAPSDVSTPPGNSDTVNANTKTAYTHDGISYISKERVEENIKAGVAKPGDYEEVQVPLDTFVVGGSTF
ncbi:MAG TPA: hypothetical protein PKK68_04780 [Methanothrix soehngenii]|jgi:hypothetical protein|nr:hypothetical protein [Methanothrix soehngenii]